MLRREILTLKSSALKFLEVLSRDFFFFTIIHPHAAPKLGAGVILLKIVNKNILCYAEGLLPENDLL